MVKICDKEYPIDSEEKYKEHFSKYPFPLSDFQKYAIEGIVNNNHVLVTAHTGSGKTLPAEFAIQYFTGLGKRVIYTSPIKALSNEKYHDFTKKFPDISIGILTGDIKFNPDADVLIMTTEILQNHLYNRCQDIENKALNFDMNIDQELGCVVFDEIHYINDKDRGKVWEETILMLPENISMVMLSATIDKADKFALWCENRYKDSEKKVILTGTDKRVVPLKHYIYLDSIEQLFKILKDKDKEKEIKGYIKKPMLLKIDSKINDDVINKTNKLLTLMRTKKVYMKPSFVLNSLINYLYKNEMLPAICFVFSRLNVEKYAHQITVNLFDYDDAHIPSIIGDECDKIIRKLPNYDEYKNLNEYKELVNLFGKGVAIHHSGMMPILREMVELIFSKGYIKVLFATETFAVGINMPTKTVIFTAMSKYTSDGNRNLYSHEYTQMAGRAGRRGIDTIGHVIHCNNLFRESVSLIEYKQILSGKPQVLQSKFQISYNLLLNLIAVNNMNYSEYVKSSMLSDEINKNINGYKRELSILNIELEEKEQTLILMNIDVSLINEYTGINDNINNLNNKKRKQAYLKLDEIKNNYGKKFDCHLSIINDIKKLQKQISNLDYDINDTYNYVDDVIKKVLNILNQNGYIENIGEVYQLTVKGKVAATIRETNCLLMTEIIFNGHLDNLNLNELVSFFSCFTNISVQDDYKTNIIHNNKLSQSMITYKNWKKRYADLDEYMQFEEEHFDIIDECYEWCDAENEAECKKITNDLFNKGLFVGEFVKAILKINNIVNECITSCEVINNIPLLEKLNKIGDKTLKYIVLQQSLYI